VEEEEKLWLNGEVALRADNIRPYEISANTSKFISF
jgi:hypothetical protein